MNDMDILKKAIAMIAIAKKDLEKTGTDCIDNYDTLYDYNADVVNSLQIAIEKIETATDSIKYYL